MPAMTTESMNVFLREFKRYSGKREVVIIMNNAPSHRSNSLDVPEDIDVRYLLLYSPELNPVERVFGDIKKLLKNRMFRQLEELEEAIFI